MNRGSLPPFGFHVDMPFVLFDDGVTDRQSQSQTFLSDIILCREIGIEYFGEMFGSDPATIVLY